MEDNLSERTVCIWEVCTVCGRSFIRTYRLYLGCLYSMWKIIYQNVPFVFGRFVQYVEDNLSERTVCIWEVRTVCGR